MCETEVLLTFLSSSPSFLSPPLHLYPSGEEKDERGKDKYLQQLPLIVSVCVCVHECLCVSVRVCCVCDQVQYE